MAFENFKAPKGILSRLFFNGIIPILAGLWRCWVASVLWVWFLTPAFGINVPAYWLLYGVLMFWYLITTRITGAEFMAAEILDEEVKKGITYLAAITNIAMATIFLILGYFIHWIVQNGF